MARKVSYEKRIQDLLDSAGVKNPPIPVEKVARVLELRIQRSPLPDDLSGLLVRHPSFDKPVIGVNSLHARVRQRFTIAHEIGHFLLHKKAEVYVDRQFSVSFRNSDSSSAEHRNEIQANRFAAELLMPASFLRTELGERTVDLGDEELLEFLASRFQVSTQAIAYRLMNLGYMPQM